MSPAKAIGLAGAAAVGLPIWWSEPYRIENIDYLRRSVKEHGGRIHQYQRMLSMVFVVRRWPQFEWVSPDSTATKVGRKHAAFCAVCGWWSIVGWIFTPALIINNLLGGIDVTEVLSGEKRDEVALERALADLERAEKRQQYVLVSTVALIFVIILVFVIKSVSQY
jgi:hypothetical protein